MLQKLPLLIIFIAGYVYAQPLQVQAPALINSLETINKNDRILILAPHPDDETIGCAGVIQQAVAAKANIRVVYLTNGDHNQAAFIVFEKRLTLRQGEFIHMGEVRRTEAIKAMHLLGVDEKNLIFLGYPDFGTFTIFNQYWGDSRPFRSLLTRISSVPYKENLSFGAPYKGDNILGDLKKVLLSYKPNKIFVSHPADVNVDHKSLYLFLQVALLDLRKELPRPKIYPYLIHCVGWPKPRHYHPELGLTPPEKFLNSQIGWSKLELNPKQLEKKHQAILRYKSQTQSSAFYLLAFARKNELFGDYPLLEIKNEKAMQGQGTPAFLGSSDIFTDAGAGQIIDADEIIEGKGQVSYAISEDVFLIRIDKTRELNNRFGIMLYIFGYSRNKPFNQMPKLRIVTRHTNFKVFNGKKLVKAEGIDLKLSEKELVLKVPLALLGGPDFIMTSVKTHAAGVAFETSGYRLIEIK
ncbi:MAG: PIG-L family deacetylase [Candidatus Omnitrophica bacterium]|nr:PIG-L family deacetylase [Candidatus Omnitrophota bacterium]